MVILQLKKIIVNSSSTTSGCSSNNNSVSSPSLREPSSNHLYEGSSPCKSPFIESFSSASMISSNELFKDRLDLKKKKQLSLNSHHHVPSNSPTLTPTTPTTPHSPSHSAHSPSRIGKQPRSRLQATGIQNLKEKVIEEIPSVFEVCFGSKPESTLHHSSGILESDEFKQLQDTLQAEYCKLRPVTIQVDREQRADKTTVCSMKTLTFTLHLPHLNRRKRN